jgi:hypothetical protein
VAGVRPGGFGEAEEEHAGQAEGGAGQPAAGQAVLVEDPLGQG